MNLFAWYNRIRNKKRAIRFANELAFHMHSVYIYLAERNRTLQPGSCVKEAVGLLDNWKKISENLYEHKPTGFALEIRPDTKLVPLTKSILDIELGEMLSGFDEADKSAIQKRAHGIVDGYFENNSFKDKIGA